MQPLDGLPDVNSGATRWERLATYDLVYNYTVNEVEDQSSTVLPGLKRPCIIKPNFILKRRGHWMLWHHPLDVHPRLHRRSDP